MIRSATDFQRLQTDGRTRAQQSLLIRFRRNGLETTRYGISTGRRIGNAVVRNRVRRRLRTILGKLGTRVGAGWDVLIVTRPSAAVASQADLEAVLSRLLGSAGLIEDGSRA